MIVNSEYVISKEYESPRRGITLVVEFRVKEILEEKRMHCHLLVPHSDVYNASFDSFGLCLSCAVDTTEKWYLKKHARSMLRWMLRTDENNVIVPNGRDFSTQEIHSILTSVYSDMLVPES